MPSELDALRTAKLLLNQHGLQEARRILQERAMDEHFACRYRDHDITQMVLSALDKLTRGPNPDETLH